MCSFSKIIVVGIPLGAVSSRIMGSWPDRKYQECVSSSEVDLKLN